MNKQMTVDYCSAECQNATTLKKNPSAKTSSTSKHICTVVIYISQESDSIRAATNNNL